MKSYRSMRRDGFNGVMNIYHIFGNNPHALHIYGAVYQRNLVKETQENCKIVKPRRMERRKTLFNRVL